jgi:hypothetical protein
MEEQHVGIMRGGSSRAGYLDCIHYCHPGEVRVHEGSGHEVVE